VATCPANWVELTGGGEIQRLAETPDRMQRKVSAEAMDFQHVSGPSPASPSQSS